MKQLLTALLLCIGASTSYASSIELYNFTNATTIVRSQHTEVVSIASITKLFTASLILNENLDLNEKVKVQGKSAGRFPVGSMVTRIELMKGGKPLIQVDGGISLETIGEAASAGANCFVAGSAVYKSADPENMVQLLRKSAEEHFKY